MPSRPSMPQVLVDDPQALALGIGYAAYRAMANDNYRFPTLEQWSPYPSGEPLFGWFANGWGLAAQAQRAGNIHAAIQATQGGHVV